MACCRRTHNLAAASLAGESEGGDQPLYIRTGALRAAYALRGMRRGEELFESPAALLAFKLIDWHEDTPFAALLRNNPYGF